MKVRELIEKLQTQDPEDVVLLSADPEGNSFGTVHDVEAGTFSGPDEVGIRELTHELAKQGYSEEDVKEAPCVILWP